VEFNINPERKISLSIIGDMCLKHQELLIKHQCFFLFLFFLVASLLLQKLRSLRNESLKKSEEEEGIKGDIFERERKGREGEKRGL